MMGDGKLLLIADWDRLGWYWGGTGPASALLSAAQVPGDGGLVKIQLGQPDSGCLGKFSEIFGPEFLQLLLQYRLQNF